MTPERIVEIANKYANEYQMYSTQEIQSFIYLAIQQSIEEENSKWFYPEKDE